KNGSLSRDRLQTRQAIVNPLGVLVSCLWNQRSGQILSAIEINLPPRLLVDVTGWDIVSFVVSPIRVCDDMPRALFSKRVLAIDRSFKNIDILDRSRHFFPDLLIYFTGLSLAGSRDKLDI
ncbi:MAG: hypothetical protein WCH39_18590, partial [Schlesneria sp.]